MSDNILDRAISYVAPAWGAERARSRVLSANLSGYQAAKRELAALRNFNPRARTADEDALPGLSDMRARSRELLRNAPIATGAVNTVVTNVVGTGLRCSAQVDRKTLATLARVTPEEAEAFEDAAEREWRLFCKPRHADAARRLSFAAQQELAFRSVLASGDCFAAMVAAPSRDLFDFAVQLIEADRVSNPGLRADSDTLAAGIELAGGTPVACHVAELSRTGTGPRNWRRLPFEAGDGSPRVLHLMHQQRIGQSRGVPYLAPVIAVLKDLDRYTEAEITAAVLNASLAVLGESPTGDSNLKREAEAAGTPGPSTGLRRMDVTFEPGMVLEGFMPGETLKSFSPERPNEGFDPFVQALLRQVGVALELPFEVLVKHFTASYSAARAALLQAWGFFRARRAWLADGFCQPVYELVITNAVLRGRIEAKGFEDPLLRAAWLGARWTGPSAGQLDPLKEVNAAEKRIALKISTRTRETAELTGDDWEAVAAELATEEALLDALDLSDDPVAPAATASQGMPLPDDTEDDTADPPPIEGGLDLEREEAA